MNDRLIRGDQNTSLPYHDQFRGGSSNNQQQDRHSAQQDNFSRHGQSGGNQASGSKNDNNSNFNKGASVAPFQTGSNLHGD